MDAPRINLNLELNGIELFFDKKPTAQTLDAIKNQGFRWNSRYKKWYAKHSAEREKFVKDYFKNSLEQNPKTNSTKIDMASNKVVSKIEDEEISSELIPNTFSSYFSSIGIGNDKIYKDADISIIDFRNGFRGAYFENENVYVSIKNGDETIYVYDLDGAMENKKTCNFHTLEVNGFGLSREDKDTVLYLVNELGLYKVSDLIDAVKKGNNLKDLKLTTYEVKGNRVFSPFKEVSPLTKFPDRWTKTHLIKAICSGQIYKAHCDYKMSDDYAYDAARNFDKGRELSIPYLAKNYVEDWNGKTTSLYESVHNERDCVLKVSNSYQSISLYFDLDCNFEKGVTKRALEDCARREENEMKESSILCLKDVDVELDKFYDVTYLVMDENTGRYKEEKDLVQGIHLIDYEDPSQFHFIYEKIVALDEKHIEPDKFYQVSNLFHKTKLDLDDRNYIPLGNSEVIVSGRYLLEKADNGGSFSYISEKITCGNSFESIKEHLEKFVSGTLAWGVESCNVNYKDSLLRLKETKKSNEQEKTNASSLFDRISEIEKTRKIEPKKEIAKPFFER